MTLLKDWINILKKAWSIRLMIFAGILSGLEVALPLIDQFVEIPRGIFAAASGIVVCAAFVARILAQQGLSDGE